ncbi:MAG TPA: tetratricopeptide repeat protein, partial [Candidatus Marinimicrobia bacterium]|nr:tetratricopeptide repeat protein [Candidatus Neomarinimicrobiota bacterium]
VCYQKLNQPKLAIQDYRKAIELRPDDADLYYNLGSIYWVQGRWQDVVKAWEKCLKLDPDHPRVRQYLPTARKKTE